MRPFTINDRQFRIERSFIAADLLHLELQIRAALRVTVVASSPIAF